MSDEPRQRNKRVQEIMDGATPEAIARDHQRLARDEIKAFVERVERLNGERKELSNDVRDVYAEAKARGFSTRALKRVIRVREYDAEHGVDARKSEEAIFDTYMNALGMA